MTALEDLRALKYPLTEEQIAKFHQTERNKVLQEQAKKRKRRERLEEKRDNQRLKKLGIVNLREKFPNSDDRFYFIAGYTSGGAPYGVTWEQMGLEPYENPGEED
jgi:Na+-translocating ferredoxin:NAD+ oxidoreductase RnfG subunit